MAIATPLPTLAHCPNVCLRPLPVHSDEVHPDPAKVQRALTHLAVLSMRGAISFAPICWRRASRPSGNPALFNCGFKLDLYQTGNTAQSFYLFFNVWCVQFPGSDSPRWSSPFQGVRV